VKGDPFPSDVYRVELLWQRREKKDSKENKDMREKERHAWRNPPLRRKAWFWVLKPSLLAGPN